MPSLNQDLFIPPSQSSTVEIPSPLRVIKRCETKKAWPKNPRKTSSTSFDDGPKKPLTVLKKRQSRAGIRNKENWGNGSDKYQVESSPFHTTYEDAVMQSSSTASDAALDKPRDPLTPRADNVSRARRSSSVQIRSVLSPSRLVGLRSLSKGRVPSAKITRRYRLRESSQSSNGSSFDSLDARITKPWDQSSGSSLIGLPLGVDRYSSPSFRLTSDSLPSVPTPDSSILDPYVLVPRISVTPEVRELSDGQSSVWAAIQISGQLFCPHTNDHGDQATNPSANYPCFMPVHHGGAGLSRYGYLYDIRVDVLPTTQTSIIDLVDINSAPRILGPGSSLLLLANVHIGALQPSQTNTTPQHESNSMIADLEHQLGSFEVEYLQVRVSYSHSGFPSFKEVSLEDNVSSCQTRLESTATGVIKRHNSRSTWSPRPTPTPNTLFSIIASHWGPIRAKEMLHTIMAQRTTTPHRTATLSGPHNSRNSSNNSRPGTASPGGTVILSSPPRPMTAIGARSCQSVRVPRRRTSLQKHTSPPIMSHQEEEQDIDPARKIWMEMRRTSSGVDHPTFHVSKANRSPAATTKYVALQHRAATPPPPDRAQIKRRREQIREAAVRNRRSIGADSLKSLVPSPSLSMTSTNSQSDKVERSPFDDSPSSSPLMSNGKDSSGRPDVGRQQQQQYEGGGRKRGDGGRWSLGNWW
ncbi:hypothetical protein F5X99DRAFT_80420 [Biscogniauxia marginata]|nr:hypothetical protein F5X99DRAFT_80420 [Biscogniauxia marginata]